MSFYAYINLDFKKFIEDIDIISFSNEFHKFTKKITIQSIIFFIPDIKNLHLVKKYFTDDKLKNIEPYYLHYLAIIIIEQLNIKNEVKCNEDSIYLSERKHFNKKLFSEVIKKEKKDKDKDWNKYESSSIFPKKNTINLLKQTVFSYEHNSPEYSFLSIFHSDKFIVNSEKNRDKKKLIRNLLLHTNKKIYKNFTI